MKRRLATKAPAAALVKSKMRKSKPAKQAPALSAKQWNQWLQWLLERAGARVYLVVFMTAAFGLRRSEALALRREDVHLNAAVPKIKVAGGETGNRKSPGEVYVRKQHLNLMRKYFAEGAQTERSIGHKHGKGSKKTVLKKEHYRVPSSGYIFTSRKGAGSKHLHYQAVYAHVRRQAPALMEHLLKNGEKVSPEIGDLRPHSGRAQCITELMGEGLTIAMSMKYARHAPSSYKVHLNYGRLTLEDVKVACDKLVSSRGRTKWAGRSTQDLLRAQTEIQQELAGRVR